MKALPSLLLGLFLIVALAPEARPHALQPGYLDLQLSGPVTWRAYWRKPDVQGQPMKIDVLLPENCDQRTPPDPRFDGVAWNARWVATCPGGLAGGVIAVPGLDQTQTDVLVRYELEQGQGEARRLTSKEPYFMIPSEPGSLDVLETYFGLGIEHILQGIDHLLFVFALLLLIPDRWRLLGAVTAFTVAHSITLAAATLGWITVPGPPVEAVIALSIMFLASELAQRDGTTERLSERFPWVVSFAFGLLHGLGFAGALEQIGLPKDDVPLALLSFNLGVEAGQILFIFAVLVAGALLARIGPTVVGAVRSPGDTLARTNAYAIGCVSAYWFIDRVAAF
jgi:hydrogenase/urease accessory protein HupE